MINIEKSNGYVEGNFRFPESTLAAHYFTYLDQGNFDNPVDRLDNYRVLKKADLGAAPFLTVVTRTQGKRTEELNETLLCLSGQSDMDFELLLVAHNVNQCEEDLLIASVEMQPEWLRKKITLVSVVGGSRSRPLNVAFSLARGEYVSILDDDDLVFDNWVASFHEAAGGFAGAILFSYVFTQEWEVRKTSLGERFLRASASPKPDYCQDFNFLKQIVTNYCPVMGLAFPRFLFEEHGLRFDESLTTTEDWDFLMQAYPICGVENTGEPVAIYRLWDNSENSHKLHSDEEWERNRLLIQEKLKKSPILLPSSFMERLIAREEGFSHYVKLDSEDVNLYFDPGKDISKESFSVPTSSAFSFGDKTNSFEFSNLSEKGYVSTLVFRPAYRGLITIENIQFEVFDTKGKCSAYSTLDISYNGVSSAKNSISIMDDTPWLILRFNHPRKLEKLEVAYQVRGGVATDVLAGTRLVLKVKEKIRRLFRKVGA